MVWEAWKEKRLDLGFLGDVSPLVRDASSVLRAIDCGDTPIGLKIWDSPPTKALGAGEASRMGDETSSGKLKQVQTLFFPGSLHYNDLNVMVWGAFLSVVLETFVKTDDL